MEESKLKNEFVRYLDDMPSEYAAKAISAFAKIVRKYSFESRETALSTDVYRSPELVDIYIKLEYASNRSRASVKSYEDTLKAFFATIQKDPKDVSDFDILCYLMDYQERRNVSTETLNGIRTVLHSFYAWAAASKYVPGNPVMLVKKFKTEKKQRDFLDDTEVEIVRSVCETPRESAMIEVMLSGALRIAEIVNIKLTDIDYSTWTIKVLGKGNKERIVKLTPRAIMSVCAYLNSRSISNNESDKLSVLSTARFCPVRGTYLFVSERAPHNGMTTAGFRKAFYDIIDRANIQSGKHITPHTMRHTWATLALRKGMPLEQVSSYLGHANCRQQ